MRSIPTMFDGVQMRSLLEAKWASFFTLLGWRWQYEPLDLDGWIPDFLIHSETGKHLLVDVKPFFDDEELEPIKRKVERAINPEKFVPWITAAAPLMPARHDDSNNHTVGWVMSNWLDEWLSEKSWETAVIIHPTRDKNIYGLAEGGEGSFKDKITGIYEGDHYYRPLSFFEVCWLWKAACNRVQWQPRREAGS